MKPERTGTPRRARLLTPRIAVGALVAFCAVLLIAVFGAPPEGDIFFDPASTYPNGARALVELLGALGSNVVVLQGQAPTGPGYALVLSDSDTFAQDSTASGAGSGSGSGSGSSAGSGQVGGQSPFAGSLGSAQRSALDAWVRSGGHLVVADPYSSLSGTRSVGSSFFSGSGALPGVGNGGCTSDPPGVAGAAQIGSVDPTNVIFGGAHLLVPPGSTACFVYPANQAGVPPTAFLLGRHSGGGTVVDVAGQGIFTNGLIGHADNAALASAVLGGGTGATVYLVFPPVGSTGTMTLMGMVDTRSRAVLIGIAVAVAVLAACRARRLGPPVEELQPVEIDGSELTGAMGRLMQRSRKQSMAAGIIRGEVRRTIAERMGVPVSASGESTAHMVSARTGIPVDNVVDVLAPDINGMSDEDLARYARRAEHLRRRVVRSR